MRVLIVDDNVVNRMLPAKILTQVGCEVAQCEDGPSALALLEREQYACMLLDISMPGMSGIELCRLLREKAVPTDMRIIAYTAHALPEEAASIMQQGFDDILVKPITRKALLDILGLSAAT